MTYARECTEGRDGYILLDLNPTLMNLGIPWVTGISFL